MTKQQSIEYPEISSLSKNTKKLVVLLHGVGSDGHDLIGLIPYIQKELPDYHFISPHGVEAFDMAPYGRQWFSLQDRTPTVIYDLVQINALKIEEIINKKQKELNVTNENTVLWGFSQGTMMSVFLTLTSTSPYSATIAFSGMLILPSKISNYKTPICIIHGREDKVVPVEESIKMAEYLSANNIENQKLIIPYLNHSIDASGLEFAVNFLKNK